MIRSLRPFLLLGAALALAGSSGFLVAKAVTGQSAPTTTVTIDIPTGTGATGPQGPAGPPGPAGPAGSPGAESCPTGYVFGAVVFNTPGGHQQIATCLKQ